VLVNATNESGARLVGGVVASTVDIHVSASANGFALSIPSFPPRELTIVSDAKAVGSEKAITSTAVIQIPNDVSEKAVVESWSTPNP
jgi:hypothetical protein